MLLEFCFFVSHKTTQSQTTYWSSPLHSRLCTCIHTHVTMIKLLLFFFSILAMFTLQDFIKLHWVLFMFPSLTFQMRSFLLYSSNSRGQVMELLERVLDFYIFDIVNIDKTQFGFVPGRVTTGAASLFVSCTRSTLQPRNHSTLPS